MRFLALALSIMAFPLGGAFSSAATARQAFTVRSTLTGKTVLPHRIRWLGIPSVPPAKAAPGDR